MNENQLMHWGILGMRWGVRRSKEQLAKGNKSKKPPDYESMTDDELRKRVGRMLNEKQYMTLSMAKEARGKEGVKKFLEVAGSAINVSNSAMDVAMAVNKSKAKKVSSITDDEVKKKETERLAKELEKFTKVKSDIKATSEAFKGVGNANNLITNLRSKANIQSPKILSDDELKERVDRLNLEQQYATLSGADNSKGHNYVKNFLQIAGGVLATTSTVLSIATAVKQLRDKKA